MYRQSCETLSLKHIRVSPPNAVSQRKAAIQAASGDLLLFLDDDVVLEVDCLNNLSSTLQSSDDVVAVVADFNNQAWSRPTIAWRLYLRLVHNLGGPSLQGRVVGPLLRFGYFDKPDEPSPMEWIATCNSLVRRSAYDQSGGFSEFFLHRCTMNEDVDLGLKLGRLGRILFCPRATLAHHHAPGGRVAPGAVAEDDVFNRYKVLHHTLRKSRFQAFNLVVQFVAIETLSNLLGVIRHFHANGFGGRLIGRLRGLAKVLND
jgi:cellulose synthase/poly-beta-1,6-N-acetylglucosamine synthase-like glycosyltransferase